MIRRSAKKDFDILFSSNNLIHEIALNSKGRFEAEEIQNLMSVEIKDVEIDTWAMKRPTSARGRFLFGGNNERLGLMEENELD